jgi:hypothetical protein
MTFMFCFSFLLFLQKSKSKNICILLFMSGSATTYTLVSLTAQRRALEDGIAIAQGMIDKETPKKNRNEELLHELHQRVADARTLLQEIQDTGDDQEQVVVEK